VPEHCIRSVIDIRSFLTDLLLQAPEKSKLSDDVRALRASCRKFLDLCGSDHPDRGKPYWSQSFDAWVFMSALGEL